jgi:hypothetical protein
MTPRAALVVLVVLAGLLPAVPAGAKTLRGTGGFRATAPSGYSLKSGKDRVYSISGRAGKVLYARLSTAVTPGAAGTALLNQLGLARNSASATSSKFSADVGDARDRRHIVIRRGGRRVLVSTMTISRSGGLRTLDAIARTATGGLLKTLKRGKVKEKGPRYPVAPIKRNDWVTMDVPRGFDAQPTDVGSVFIANKPGQPQGSAAFGVPALITDPNQYLGCQYGPQFCGGPCDTVYPYTTAADALVNVLPSELANLQCRAGVAPNQRKQITNMRAAQLLVDGPLGQPYSSGGVFAHFTFDGKPWSAVVLLGTAYLGSDSPYWLLYYSYIAVPDTPLGLRAGLTQNGEDRSFQKQLIQENLAESLMQSWRSWKINPSVQNARFQQMKMSIDETTATIREVHEFRYETYSRVNEKWDEYIRYSPPEE